MGTERLVKADDGQMMHDDERCTMTALLTTIID